MTIARKSSSSNETSTFVGIVIIMITELVTGHRVVHSSLWLYSWLAVGHSGPRRGRPILLIARVIADWIGLSPVTIVNQEEKVIFFSQHVTHCPF